MATPETLDQLLEHADAGYGLAVLTDNPHRLHVEINARMRHHRQAHPDAYRHITVVNSKSPKELYLVNRLRTKETRAAHTASREAPPAS